MRRSLWVFLSAFVVVGLFALIGHVRANSNLNGESVAGDAYLSAATRGVVFNTAAINSDGTIAGCFNCNRLNTVHLSTGAYQVGFNSGNITAANGWSRFVQVDTLSTGAILNVSCTTADRVSLTSAVFVACFNGSGALVDTSFFLFVAR
jgi:hypothetical protein